MPHSTFDTPTFLKTQQNGSRKMKWTMFREFEMESEKSRPFRNALADLPRMTLAISLDPILP